MTQTQLNIFQSILISKHTELVREQGRRDGIAIVRTPDALDEVQFASERELSTRSLERGSTALRDVRAALWATLCLMCQEHADRKPHQAAGWPERFLREAA